MKSIIDSINESSRSFTSCALLIDNICNLIANTKSSTDFKDALSEVSAFGNEEIDTDVLKEMLEELKGNSSDIGKYFTDKLIKVINQYL